MAAFVYHDGEDVPRDVTRVVVHHSVRVLPPEAFRGCEKLREVQLNEGLEEIGEKAFLDCVSLGRLGCPSTVVRIGAWAFAFCGKMEEVRLNEGLEDIGDGAFHSCLWLRHLDCPSTVVRIGGRAFGSCTNLSAVKLAGIVNVEGGAFSRSITSPIALEIRIQIPPRALVVQQGNCRLVTDGRITIARTSDQFVLIAPRCLTTLPESNLTELGSSIGEIMNNVEGTVEDRLGQVRREVRKEVRGEVSAILGLAFWKAKIDEAERVLIGAVSDHCENTEGERRRAEGGNFLSLKARDGCRGEGKGKLIAQNVLPYLDGL